MEGKTEIMCYGITYTFGARQIYLQFFRSNIRILGFARTVWVGGVAMVTDAGRRNDAESHAHNA